MRRTFPASALFFVPLAALACALLLPAGPASAQVVPPAAPGVPAFHHLDTNGDGRVSLEEVMAYAKKKSDAVQPFRIVDADLDGDGKITPEERRKAGITGLEGEGTISVKDLDMNGDGYVSREDLDEYFNRKHREAFARADADKDGSLKASEFVLFRFK